MSDITPFLSCDRSGLGRVLLFVSSHTSDVVQRSTGEVYNEKWPATPFTIRITNRSYPGPAEAQVFVDGRLAAVRVGAPAPDPRMRLKTFQSNCNTFPDCHCCQSARPTPRPRTAIVASALPCVRLLGDARA